MATAPGCLLPSGVPPLYSQAFLSISVISEAGHKVYLLKIPQKERWAQEKIYSERNGLSHGIVAYWFIPTDQYFNMSNSMISESGSWTSSRPYKVRYSGRFFARGNTPKQSEEDWHRWTHATEPAWGITLWAAALLTTAHVECAWHKSCQRGARQDPWTPISCIRPTHGTRPGRPQSSTGWCYRSLDEGLKRTTSGGQASQNEQNIKA